MLEVIHRHSAEFGPQHTKREIVFIPIIFLVVFLVMGVC